MAKKRATKKKAVKKTARKTKSKAKAGKKVLSKKTTREKTSKKVIKKKATKTPAKAKALSKKATKITAPKKAPTPKPKPEPEPPPKPIKLKLSAAEKKKYRVLLLAFRDRVDNGINFLAVDNLNRSAKESSGDQGTDNFDREFALNLVSGEQDLLHDIDEALRRLDAGTFGICELTGQPIEKARLEAIPYAKHCLAAQEGLERGRARYRPFGSTISQSQL